MHDERGISLLWQRAGFGDWREQRRSDFDRQQ
jgi:hypothetical protein